MAGHFPFTFSYRRTIFNFVGTRALRFCASLTVIVIFCSTTLLTGEQSSKLDPTSIQLKQHALQLADSNAVGNNSPYTLKPDHDVAVTLTTEEKAWIHDHPVVLYGAETDWPPFDFVDHEGKHLGFSSDMLQLIGKHSGLSFQPEVDTWGALLKKVKAKKIDVLPAIFETEERKPYLNFTQSYQQILPYFFINAAVSATTLEDLNGKTIAIPKDFAQVKKVKQQFPKLRLLETETLMGAIQAVIERKADVILETYPVINYVLKQNGITSIRPFKPIALGDTWELRMAVRKDMPLLHSIINKTMATIPAKEKQQLTDKWLGYLENQDDRQFQLTNPERQWLAAHPVIRFTGDPNWLPYEAFDSKGRYVGMVADYLRVLEKKLPIKFDIVPTKTWNESVNLVKRNEVDVLSATIDYPDLQTDLDFTQAYLSSPIVIVMRNQEDYVDTIDEIKHRRIAVLKDYGYNVIIFHNYPNIKFSEFDTVDEGLTAVSTGKVDALLSTLAQATYHISNLGMNNVRVVGKTEFTTHVGLGVRKELSPLVLLLNRALNNISAKEKEAISDQWGKDRFVTKTNYQLIAKIVAGFLLLLLLAFFWNRRLTKEINRRKQSEQQVMQLNQRLALATSVASFGVWELDLQGQSRFVFDDKMYEIYGITEKRQLSWDEWLQYVHSDDHALIEQSLAKLNAQGGELHIEFRIIRPDGSIRNIYSGSFGTLVNDKLTNITGVNWDITARKKIELDLEKAKLQAEKATLAKSQFLANMSHEIRTPLNAIIGFTELLNEQVKDSKLQSFVKTIQTAGHSLLTLINDILDLSKIDAGKMRIEKKACNPHNLFHELGQIFMISIKEKKLDFILDIDQKIPENLILDATRLRQILFNLIGNAVKFTENGHICLRARTGNEDAIRSKLDLYIDVKDTGIGISKNQQALIFKDFEQLEGQDVSKYGGTGLGLSISKRLTELMGGEISLVSEPNSGSTFTVHLKDVDVSSIALEPEAIKSSKRIHFHPANVLVVDDIEDNRNLLKECFAGTQLTVSDVNNGLEAINAVKQGNIDMVLMDIRMPIMDGYQASEQIKAFSNMPIISLTASVMEDDYERAKNSHFDGYLRKPVLKADLITELMRFLPFEAVEEATVTENALLLTKAELLTLPNAIKELEEMSKICGQISKNNNMSEIKTFADTVLMIGASNEISVVTAYATQLHTEIDCFDIISIKHSLDIFPALLVQLQDYNRQLS